MASLTKKRKVRVKHKLSGMGKDRKRETRSGTTPRFPVHVDNEPDAVLPMPPGSHPDEK